MNFENTTARLEMRVLTPQHAPMVLDFYRRNAAVFEAYEPMIGDNFYSLAHQKAVLSYEYQQTIKSSMIRFWLFEKSNLSKIIGTVCFHNITRPVFSCCNVGYKMDQNYTNRGYCKEALAAGMELLMQEMDLHRFEAYVMPDNLPSIHLLETLGFQREGLMREKVRLKDSWYDHYLYAYISENASASTFKK